VGRMALGNWPQERAIDASFIPDSGVRADQAVPVGGSEALLGRAAESAWVTGG